MIYVYDGTLEGFLSAVFDIYVNKTEPLNIVSAQSAFQPDFDTPCHTVETTDEKAARLMTGMDKIGGALPGQVIYAFLSHMPDREMVIYRYIAMGFEMKEKLFQNLHDDTVRKVLDMERQTGVEKQKMKGFLRFSVTENNVFYAEMSPKNNILPLIMAHFCRRFRVKPFMIRDRTYNQLGIFDTRGWYIHSDARLNGETDTRTLAEAAAASPNLHESEERYRYMWKRFYDITAMNGRENIKGRNARVPQRYQRHMTEHQDQPYVNHPSHEQGRLYPSDPFDGGSPSRIQLQDDFHSQSDGTKNGPYIHGPEITVESLANIARGFLT